MELSGLPPGLNLSDPNTLLKLQGRVLERDLRGFVREAWPHVDPAKFMGNWHIDAICDHLQAVSNREIHRLIINIPPRRGKSLLVSVLWPAYTWAHTPVAGTWLGPATKFLFASYAGQLAVRDSVKSRRLMESRWYRERWGHRVQFAADQNQKSRFLNLAGGERIATSVGGQLTGEGGDIIGIDDPHNAVDIHSDTERQGVLDWWSESMSSRLNDVRTGCIVMIMQRLHERDLVGHILSRELGWDHLCIPEKWEPDHPYPIRTKLSEKDPERWRDPRPDNGETLLWSERFPANAYRDLALSMGPYAEAGQLQQRPAPREGGLFKRAWFEVVDAAPAKARRVRGWDLAATDTGVGDPDWTAGVLISRDSNGIFYIEHVEHMQGTPLAVEQTILNFASQDGKKTRIRGQQDPGQAGKSQAQHLARKLAGYNVRFKPMTGSKVTRAEPMAAQAEAGNIKLVRGPWNDVFLQEMGMFPNAAHDDQVDAAATAFDALVTEPTGSIRWGGIRGAH